MRSRHADGMEVVAAVDPGAAGTTVDTGVDGAVIECRSDLATTIDDDPPRRHGRLHAPDASSKATCGSRWRAAWTASWARPGSPRRSWQELAALATPGHHAVLRTQLRDRRGADDGLRCACGAVHAARRDHRTASRPEGRRSQRHRAAHGRTRRRRARRSARRLQVARPRLPGSKEPAELLRRRRSRALDPSARARRAPGGPVRRSGADALDPPRHHRPQQLHARRRACGSRGRLAASGLVIGLEKLMGE